MDSVRAGGNPPIDFEQWVASTRSENLWHKLSIEFEGVSIQWEEVLVIPWHPSCKISNGGPVTLIIQQKGEKCFYLPARTDFKGTYKLQTGKINSVQV